MSEEADIFDSVYEEKVPDFKKTLNVAFIGKVSTGKSSLINAVLKRDKGDVIAQVGAESGVTTEIKVFKLDDHVSIIDSPGLGDIKKENSEVTKKFLSSIDVGIMVVSGSADSSQKSMYQELSNSAAKVFVVLNKIDEWDDLEETELEKVILQWENTLGVDKVYPVCTKGYDPRSRKDAPLDLRGIDKLSDDVWSYLRGEGKDLLLSRHLGDKRGAAIAIIAGSLAAVGGEAFIPGSAAYITATQAAAITSLNYLYTGEVLSKSSAFALLPTFMGQSLGTTTFLWAKSFLPPTGVVDIAAAGVAIVITLAMLSAVTYVLSSGYELDQKEKLKEQFNKVKNSTDKDLVKDILSVFNGEGNTKDNISKVINKFIFSNKK